MPRCHISRGGVGVDVGVSSYHLLHHLSLLLLLLLLLLLGAAAGEEEHGFDVPPSLPRLPICGEGKGEKCLVLAKKPLSWQEAHNFCRSVGGFLASRDEYGWLSQLPYLSNITRLTWTALTPLHGHYQWLSRCPAYLPLSYAAPIEYSAASTDFTAWRAGRVPRAWDRACAGLDLETKEFELTNCSTKLPVLCFLEPNNPAGVGEGAAEDLYLVVEGDPAPGPEGNLTLRREDFGNLSLTCTAYNRTSGKPLSPQPRVFWRKDLVYSGHCIGSLIPATLHDRTKSPAAWDAAHQDAFTTQQGTYWCEAWGPPGSSTHLMSNKVLLTLQDIVVFIFEVHRKEDPSENKSENEAKEQLRRALLNKIPNIQSFPLDLVTASKEQLPGLPPKVFASYTFHLHIPKNNIKTLWQTMEEALERRASMLTKPFSLYTYENSSRVTFPNLCLSHTSPSQMEGAPHLKWPVTFIGPVHPTNVRCEIPHGRLAVVGHCVWNYTHGAQLQFKPQPCEWRDLCPQGYTALEGYYCLAVQSPGPWDESFKAVHTTSQEVSLLNEVVVKKKKVWRQVKRLVEATAATDHVWLPDRRLRAGAPLQHLGPVPRSGYNLTEHKINWAENHPLPNFECLALNLTSRTLHTHPCYAHLPFPTLIKAPFLHKRIPLQPPLWKKSILCQGWQSPIIRGANEVCFKLFRNVGNMTWTEAQDFCNERDADLPTPNIGFLDYVFRQELQRQEVEGVWMFPHWVPERVVYKGPKDILSWMADTNYSLPYGELTPKGWLLRGGGTHKDVLCQRLLNTMEHLRLNVLPLGTPVAPDMCIRADPMEMLALNSENPDLRCFVNGRESQNVTNKAPNPPECAGRLEQKEPGYYQCIGWSVAPVMLTVSNTVLQSPTAFTILVTLLEPESHYDPLLHDATFTPITRVMSQSCSCCKALNTTLTNIQVSDIAELSARRQHFLAAPDGRLLHAMHVECRGIVSTLSEFQVLESFTLQLAPGQQVGRCTVQAIRSTQGCERDITMNKGDQGSEISAGNLTWPSTYGARQVVPEEPCVTPNGEPVTRECVGDFLLGYQWGPAGHCTGTVSNLTRELWLANREPHDSLKLTEAALTANISALQPVDIFLVAKTLEAAAKAPPPNLRLAQLVSVMDSVLAADTAVFHPVQQRLGSSDTLLEAFEKLFLKINSTDREKQPQRVSGTCLSVEGLTLTPESPVIGYKSMEQPVRGRREETLVTGASKADLEDAAAAIILPTNISLQVVAGEVKEGRMATNITNLTLPLFFAVYRNDKLFQESEVVETLEGIGNRYRVNSEVIQATFGTEVHGLREPVKIYFKPRLPGNDTRCVFWDLRARGNRGAWSEEGCYSGDREGDHHVCLCYHLTCFAELINYDGSAGFTGTHAAVLNTITVVGCCLSLLGLLLVFFTFLLFQRWRRPLSNKILVNLCFAEFCSLTVFLAGIDQTVSGRLCRGVAVALHYFILTSFAWMLVEAVHQYLNFVKVVGTYIPRFMWKASVCAWGVPLLPILALLVYDSSLYDHDGSREDGTKICWMSSSGFWIGMLPLLAATMGVNVVMYGLILYGVSCGRPSVPSTMPERALLMNQLRMAVCVFFLLGLTWVFGLLAVSSARLLFSYLFCIFTTFKGFLLFVFHVCRERGARRYWEDFLSVLKHESSISSPGDSAQAAHSTGRSARLEASFNPCGGIMVLPPVVSRSPRLSTTTSLLSARSSTTTGCGSRTSFYP